MKKKVRKFRKSLPKGFLSSGGFPTQNALMMYFVYLKNLPKGWDLTQVNQDAVSEVRSYFGWSYETGFAVMIKWGIDIHCGHSTTSDERHQAMSLSYHDALGMIGQGYILCLKPIE